MSTLGGLPDSELMLEPSAWLILLGGALLIAANLWMWLVPVPHAVFAGRITSEDSLRGGMACSSAALLLVAVGLTWGLIL